MNRVWLKQKRNCEQALRTVILWDNWVVNREVIRWGREMKATVGAGIWTWWTARSLTDNNWVVAPAVCTHSDGWMYLSCHPATRQMEVYHAKQWAIRLTLRESFKKRGILHPNGITKVAVISNLNVAIQWLEHLQLGLWQPLARMINCNERVLWKVGMESEIHWVQGHSCIPRKEVTNHTADQAQAGHMADMLL